MSDETGQHDEELVIVPGVDVVGMDGEQIGTVKAVFPDFLVVVQGWFLPAEYSIAASAIAGAHATMVSLTVRKDEVPQQGWECPPTASAPAPSPE